MARYRTDLPQLAAEAFLADGGMETSLIFDDSLDLPQFAAFTVLRSEQGRDALTKYYERFAAIAARDRFGIVLDTATWRASTDWAPALGYSLAELESAVVDSVDLLASVRDRFDAPDNPVVISGAIGPRGDGYQPGELMSWAEARTYHMSQVRTLAQTEADLVSALTMTYPAEAIGIALAAGDAQIPVVVSFTVETDGNLPTGQSLADAISEVDQATAGYPAYYMVNCAHPTHFASVLEPDAPWTQRVRGVRANASARSHAELDEAEDLDPGDPAQLASEYLALRDLLPRLSVVGGCCGTNHVHVSQISAAFSATRSVD